MRILAVEKYIYYNISKVPQPSFTGRMVTLIVVLQKVHCKHTIVWKNWDYQDGLQH